MTDDRDSAGNEATDQVAGETAESTTGETEAKAEGATSTASSVLDQDEIDSLLGAPGGEEGQDSAGIESILSSALVSYERLPMLEVVFDRLVRMMSTSLRNFTSDTVEVNLESITSSRFGDYLDSVRMPAMLVVFKAEEWDNHGLMMVDSSLIYSIVDVLLGGRRGTAAMRVEGRPYTTIERNLVERMIHVLLGDLSAAFDPLSPVTFRFERLETNPRFATIVRPANAVIVAQLRIDMEDRGGRIEMLIPYATLEPVRELLLQMFMGEKFGRDSIWENHLTNELWQTEVPLEAVLDEIELSLGDVLNWRAGSQLQFNCLPTTDVVLRCGQTPMFRGRMGRKSNTIAVQVCDRLAPEGSLP